MVTLNGLKNYTTFKYTKVIWNFLNIYKYCKLIELNKIRILGSKRRVTEAAVRRSSFKKVFLKILQISLENTCVGVSF